jgi:hypothetical protein
LPARIRTSAYLLTDVHYQQAYLTKSQRIASVGKNAGIFRFARAAKAGQSEAANWNFAFPAAGAPLIALLVLVSVRPRLSEYR